MMLQQHHDNHRISRSPSTSRSRSSEKVLTSDGSLDRLEAPTFRMVTKCPSPINRRASAVHFSTTTAPSSTRTSNHTRSRSLRSKRHSAHIPHSLSGTQLDTKYGSSSSSRTSIIMDTKYGSSSSSRTSISHSLSVPAGDDQGEFHLVRNFSVTSKGIVNRGDSFRCKSRSTSLCSTPTSPASDSSTQDLSNDSGATASAFSTPGCPSTPVDEASVEPKEIPKYTVWVMGSNGVGKTSIRNQFMTSEYICQYGSQPDNWKDDGQNKSVTVSLDGAETELDIIEYTSTDEKCRPKDPLPEAFIIVYSVTNRRSYLQARQILSRLETTFGIKAAILVGNKTDLVRLRTVSTVEGRSLAKERGCKFIETSVAINHQLDELLVGIITQIRIKAKIAEKQTKRLDRKSQSSRSKATCIIKRIWRRTCMTSKSCDNLHAL